MSDASKQHHRTLIESARRDASDIPPLVPQTDLLHQEPLIVCDLQPDSFPGYTILGELHRGGQGVVYRALQNSTHRTVAIKIVRERSVHTTSDEIRFRREVRALATLRHPNIVAVHESAVVDGRPYFVMDYVCGTPLDAYVKSRVCSIAELLRLFNKICHAVHAAHVRGIIHRDLKPGNIIIDERGEPYILDFGLAKLMGEEAAPGTTLQPMTQVGQFIGSLPWASPEQAEGRHDHIDLRSDVYSLGVVFFQMLTGKFPYNVIGSTNQVIRDIVEVEPARPSAFRPDLDAEVDTIVLKCLEKEPDRRYQSAAALLEDVARFLSNEPILARPATTFYQLRKLVVRHKLPTALLAALLVSILGFGAWMGILYRQAERLRQTAEHDRTLAEANLQRAEAAESAERHAAQTAKQVSDFMIGLFEISDPSEARGSSITARDVLDRGAEKIRSELSQQPEVQASLMNTIGRVYLNLGLHGAARPLLEEALTLRQNAMGEDDVTVAECLENLATLQRQNRSYQEAEALLVRVYDTRQRALGDHHPDTLRALSNLALVRHHQEKYDEAEALYRQVLDVQRVVLGVGHADTLATLNNLAVILKFRRRLPEAEALYGEAMVQAKEALGEDHPTTLLIQLNLGAVLKTQNKLQDAEALCRQTLGAQRRVLGEEHPETLTTMNNLAAVLKAGQQFVEAELFYSQVLACRRRILGDSHLDTLTSMNNLATTLRDQGKLEEGAGLYNEALKKGASISPEPEVLMLVIRGNYGDCAARMGDYAEAEENLLAAYQGFSQKRGDAHPRTQTVIRGLVELYQATERTELVEVFRSKLKSEEAPAD